MTDTYTLISALRQQASARGSETAFRFLMDGTKCDAHITFAELDRTARATAVALQTTAQENGLELNQQPVLIALPAGLEFLGAFFGCLYAGAIAVPIRYPRPNRPMDHTINVASDSRSVLIYTTPEMMPAMEEVLGDLPILTREDITRVEADAWRDPGLGPEAIANLQYTSGSTSAPKGVVISHSNILANSADMDRIYEIDSASRLMSWLPHYHDLGLLFGCVLPVFTGCEGYLMAPATFAHRPASWLQAITAFRITHSAAPNFGFEACLGIPKDRRPDYDLSSLVALLNGAEPVRADTVAAFQEAFAPCGLGPNVQCPSYGMAENTLVTSVNGPDCAPVSRIFDNDELAQRRLVPCGTDAARNRKLVACSGARMDTEIVITDPDTGARLPDGAVGEIWQTGPLVAQGYWHRPDLTKTKFQARLAGQDGGPVYMRTGDLGALLDGELYILGRMDDVMIIRGVNISPEDIELTVEACDPALEPGGAAAFTADIGGELRLVIAHEVRRTALRTLRAGGEETEKLRDHLVKTLRAAVSSQHELEIGAIVFLGPKALPKTHTGKKKRHACRQDFAAGSLNAVLTWVAPKYAEAAPVGASPKPPTKPSRTGMTDRVRDLSGWLRHYAETRMNSRLIDERRTIPPYIVMDMGNQGLLGMIAPQAYGGLGLNNRELAVMFQQLAAVDTTVASFVVVNNALGLRPILKYATPENRAELMPRLATGRELASFAMTEADAGSNIRNLSSIGHPDGNGGWRLWGTKWWSGTASWAGVINTFVNLEGSKGDAQGVSGFVLRQGAEGLRNGPEALTMGLRGMVQSQVLLEGVRVTERDRLGELGDGMTPATNAMEYGRFAISCMALGIIKRCTQLMLRHASRRRISTGGLIDNPATRLRISELGAAATAIEALIELVADRLDHDAPLPIDLYCACKTSGPEYAWRAADGLIQQLAGRGYVESNIAPQILRDARVLRIFEGPTEPMHMHIGSRLVHMPEELCGFLSTALGESRLADDLAEMAQTVFQRGQAQAALFGGPLPARHWAYLQIGEIATYGILRAALRRKAQHGKDTDTDTDTDTALARAETWAMMRYQTLKARALEASAGEAAMLDRAQIEALAEGFADTIGDIEQSLPGEDRTLDGLLSRSGQAPGLAAPSQPKRSDAPPKPPAKTDIVTAWIKRWMAQEFVVRPETIADTDRFAAYGMDSVAAMLLVSALEDWTGTDLPSTLVWDHPSIDAIAREIAAMPGAQINEAEDPLHEVPDDQAEPARIDDLSKDEPVAQKALITPKSEIAVHISKDSLKAQFKQAQHNQIDIPEGWSPLSYGQEALWFLWTLAPESPAFSMAMPLTIRGPLDVDRLQAALKALGERHPCLRTEFRTENGAVMQRAKPDHIVTAKLIDATGQGTDEVHAAVADHAREPFDLKADVALRSRLFTVSPEHHVFLLVLHHIVGDLWSLVVLMDDLRALYANPGANLPPLSLTYEDYLRDERSKGAAGRFDPALSYWKKQLSGELPLLDLPRDKPRPAAQSFCGATEFQTIDADLITEVEALARGSEATLFMALLSAYQVLLHRYTGQNRIITGTPFSGRGQTRLADVIGDFINILPLVADLDPGQSFRECLGGTRTSVIEAIQHQECPFSLIVDAVQPARDISRPPIFQTTFVLQKFQRYPELQAALLPGDDEPAIPFADLTLEPMQLAQQDGQFDLNVEVKRDANGALQLAWKYAADLFEPATIQGIAAAYETLLRQMVAAPDRAVGDLTLLDDDAAARMIAEGKGPKVTPPAEKSVYALFAARAAETPDAPALSQDDIKLSYAQVMERVEPIARSLAARGVGPEVMVAVAMPRGLDLAISLLAVMRAGGAFLPLSPDAPVQRLRQVLEDSSAKIVLTNAALADAFAGKIADWTGAVTPQVAAFETLAQEQSRHLLPCTVADSDLAYMMYTSGSTGKPKGVMVEHLGMVNHALAKLEDLDFTANDILAQNAPQSFDVVVWQNLAPLTCGGAVCIIPDEVAEDPAKLMAYCVAHGVTVLQVVPSMMRAILEEAEATPCNPPDHGKLRWLVPTGEALPTDLCRRWLAIYPQIPILNTYGSTECSDDQCHYRLEALRPADNALPIITVGRPIRNMAAYVLDRNLSPVPAGVVGELYIGGIGVGRGYRGLPERTAKAFLPDPFDSCPSARIYRTGDLARRRADGLIDFLGRIDNMFKLHGVRIDPAEVETALNTHPAIKGAVVRPYAHPAGEKRLVSHIVLSAATEPGDIRAHLAERLPHTMIPDQFMILKALPLTPNGKLDVAALPTPDWPESDATVHVSPRTKTENKIANIWKALLKREAIGITEDFFLTGGDSIRSIQVAARCQEMGLPVQALDIFVARTVQALAEKVDLRLANRDDKDTLKATAKSAAKDLTMVNPELIALAAGMVRFDEE